MLLPISFLATQKYNFHTTRENAIYSVPTPYIAWFTNPVLHTPTEASTLDSNFLKNVRI